MSAKEGPDRNEMLGQYSRQRALYRDFAQRCEALVKELLSSEELRVHSITCREKDTQVLAEKLRGKDYACLEDVTDLAGVRVITHMADEVKDIASIIEREFDIIPEHSVDKSQLLDPDTFGYLSLHYVCKMPERRVALPEYRRFIGLICEIQVRSVLQHAWAEIEHDLGYKSLQSIPKMIRRRFSRLAALLESADDEFMRIRDELDEYQSNLSVLIQTNPAEVRVDRLSLEAFVASNKVARSLDERVAELMGGKLVDPTRHDLEVAAANLPLLGVLTMRDLDEALTSREPFLRKFQDRYAAHHHSEVNRGISIYHLTQFMLGEIGDTARIHSFCDEWDIGPAAAREEMAVELINDVADITKNSRSEDS